jgi:DNA-binding IclR family transcriptional regulator
MVDDADVYHPSFGLIFEPMVRNHLTVSATICQLKCSAGRDIGPAADRQNRRAFMGTVSKALELLNLFTRQRPLVGLSDLARLAELNKATCYRLVTELCDFGLVEQVGSTREYRLGPAVLRLSALREAQVPTREAAMPVLQALAQKTGETAHLSMLMGGALHTLGFAYATTHMTRVTMEDAEVLPFHATSSGLVVLAFQPESFREAVLARPIPRLTGQTETAPEALRARLSDVRRRGLAESRGAFQAEVHSMAVPLFNALGACVGAVAVAALASRMTEDQRHLIRFALTEAGSEITTLWGGSLPADIATLWQLAA